MSRLPDYATAMSVLPVRLPDDLICELRKEATRRGDTLSGTVRAILMDGLSQHLPSDTESTPS